MPCGSSQLHPKLADAGITRPQPRADLGGVHPRAERPGDQQSGARFPLAAGAGQGRHPEHAGRHHPACRRADPVARHPRAPGRAPWEERLRAGSRDADVDGSHVHPGHRQRCPDGARRARGKCPYRLPRRNHLRHQRDGRRVPPARSGGDVHGRPVGQNARRPLCVDPRAWDRCGAARGTLRPCAPISRGARLQRLFQRHWRRHRGRRRPGARGHVPGVRPTHSPRWSSPRRGRPPQRRPSRHGREAPDCPCR